MARRWYNEDYRKLYTRQDGPWLALPWCARALAADLLRYADDAGVVAILEDGDDPGDVLATVVRCKADEREMVARGTRALLKDGHLVIRGGRLLIKNFVPAQERLSQEAARQRRKRDKEAAMSGADNALVTVNVTQPVTPNVTQVVTPNVTPKFAVSGRVGSGRVDPPVAPQGAGQGGQAQDPGQDDPPPAAATPAASDPRLVCRRGGQEPLGRAIAAATGSLTPGADLVRVFAECAEATARARPEVDASEYAARLVEAFAQLRERRPRNPPGWHPQTIGNNLVEIQAIVADKAPAALPQAPSARGGYQPADDDNRPRPKFVERYEPPDASHLVRVKRPLVQP